MTIEYQNHRDCFSNVNPDYAAVSIGVIFGRGGSIHACSPFLVVAIGVYAAILHYFIVSIYVFHMCYMDVSNLLGYTLYLEKHKNKLLAILKACG